MSARKVTAYRCPTCRYLYASRQEVAECCQPVPEEEQGWECGECKAVWPTEAEARDCHSDANCECGCLMRWHYLGAGNRGLCLTPDCPCRMYAPAVRA